MVSAPIDTGRWNKSPFNGLARFQLQESMSQQTRTSLKPSALRLPGLRPELTGILWRRISVPLLLVCVIAWFGVPIAIHDLRSARPEFLHLGLQLVLIGMIIRHVTIQYIRNNNASLQLDSGKREKVELRIESASHGYLARVSQDLDFSVGSNNDSSEIYFVDRACHQLVGNYLNKEVIAEAVYGFAPDAPLLIKLREGILWLEVSNSELCDEAAGILLKAFGHYSKNDDAAAVELLNKALAINPKYTDALELRGYCKERLNDLDGAVQDFTLLLQQLSKSPVAGAELCSAYIARANAYWLMENYALSILDLDCAIKLAPDRADLYYIRATAHDQMDHGSLAVADHTKYLELSPDLPAGERASVLLYRAMEQDSEEATLRDLNESIATMPTPTAHYFHACLLVKADRYGEVIEECTKALELDPDFHEALELRIEAYINSGNPAAAERDIARLTQSRNREEESAHQLLTGTEPIETLNFSPDDTIAPPKPITVSSVTQPPQTNNNSPSSSIFSGKRWGYVFPAYGLISIISPIVMNMTLLCGLSGVGCGLALCAVLLLVLSLFLHSLARIAGGIASLRDTSVVVAWGLMLLWCTVWIPGSICSAFLAAICCTTYGIIQQHRLPVWRSVGIVLIPPCCLLLGVMVYVFNQPGKLGTAIVLWTQSK